MRRAFPLLALAAALLAEAAGCSSGPHPSHFTDDFDGTVFPDKAWLVGGPAPVIDTTSSVESGSGSLHWTACAGTNGAYAQIDRLFDSAFSFAGHTDFLIYGSAASANTGVAMHAAGDFGDDAVASILPPPSGAMSFFIDGLQAPLPAPTDGHWHSVGFDVDQYGQSGWFYDGQLVMTAGPVQSITWQVELVCGEGDGLPGPVPVLLDNVDIKSRPRP